MALHGFVDAHGNDAHGLTIGAAVRHRLRERRRGRAAALFDAHRWQRTEIARARDLLQIVAAHDRHTRTAGQIQQQQTQQRADDRAAHERLPPRKRIRRLRRHAGLIHHDQFRRSDHQLRHIRIMHDDRLQHIIALLRIRAGHAQRAQVRVLLRRRGDRGQRRQAGVCAHGAVEQTARENIRKRLGHLCRGRRAGAGLRRAAGIDEKRYRGRILRAVAQAGIAAKQRRAQHDQHQTQPPQAAEAARKQPQQVCGPDGALLSVFVHGFSSVCTP